MNQFLLIVIWIFIMWGVTTRVNVRRREKVCGEIRYNFVPAFALMLFAPIIIWAGMRGDFQDTGLYRELFTEMPSALSGINEYLQTVDKDLGFSVFSIILKSRKINSSSFICLFSEKDIADRYAFFRFFFYFSDYFTIDFFI